MTVMVWGPKESFFAPCQSSLTTLPEATSVPVKLRISLPSAWKVMRATLLASLATALIVERLDVALARRGRADGQRRVDRSRRTAP